MSKAIVSGGTKEALINSRPPTVDRLPILTVTLTLTLTLVANPKGGG